MGTKLILITALALAAFAAGSPSEPMPYGVERLLTGRVTHGLPPPECPPKPKPRQNDVGCFGINNAY